MKKILNINANYITSFCKKPKKIKYFLIIILINTIMISCNNKTIDLTKYKHIVEKNERDIFLKKHYGVRSFDKTGFLIQSISDIDTIRVRDSLKFINEEIRFHWGENLDIDKEIKLSKSKYEFYKKHYDSIRILLLTPYLKKEENKIYTDLKKLISKIDIDLLQIRIINNRLISLRKKIDKYNKMDSLKPLCFKFKVQYLINEDYDLIINKNEFEYYDVIVKDYLVNARFDSVINIIEYGKKIKKVKNK